MTTEMYVYPTPPKDYIKSPVVIIPGVGARWAGIKSLSDFIAKEGFSVYVVKELGDNLFEIPYSSEIVGKVIEEKDLNNVILVGHSKGGLIGKHLMINDTRKKVKGMISIASPFSGSKLANFLVIRRWKMFATTDPLILDMQKNTDVNKRIISISPSYDTLVWHKNKSNLEGALENLTLPLNGHLDMIYKELLHEKVIECIKKIEALG